MSDDVQPRIQRGRKIQKEEEEIKEVKDSILNLVLDSSMEGDLKNLFKFPSFKDLSPAMVGDIIGQSALAEARWSVLHNEAIANFEKKEMDFEIWQAKRDLEIRNEVSENKEKITETKVKNLVTCDPTFRRMQQDIINAKQKMNNLKSVSIALISKGNKAMSVANLVKEEIKLIDKI